MVLRIGTAIAATIMLAVMGTALALWGVNILPSEPLRVGFIVLVVFACLASLRTITRDPHRLRAPYTRARAAQVAEPMIVAIPATSPTGLCWQCGSPVREENKVCWKCGATQPRNRDAPPPILPAKDTDWDRSETVYRVPEPDVLPTGSLPVYQVGAPDGWNDPGSDVPNGWSTVDSEALDAPLDGERWLPSPLMPPVQVLSTESLYEQPRGDVAPDQSHDAASEPASERVAPPVPAAESAVAPEAAE